MKRPDRDRCEERDWLSRALAELPAPPAGEGFTERVLRRLPEGTPRRWPARPLLAAAALLLALAAFPAARYLGFFTGAGPAPAERERLAEQRQRLARELWEIRRALDEEAPVVYLGGDDRLDLVLDLGNVARREPALVRPAVAPARGRSAPMEDRR